MKRIDNWDTFGNSEEGERIAPLPCGIYALKIVDAIDHPEESGKEYLELHFDVVRSENAEYLKYFSKTSTKEKWNFQGTTRLYYSVKAMSLFKSRIIAIEKSNKGYSFAKSNFDEIIYHIFKASISPLYLFLYSSMCFSKSITGALYVNSLRHNHSGSS